MAVIYVTYGCGSNLANCYSKVEAPTVDECIEKINALDGKYAFTYGENAFEGQPEKWNLREVPLQKQVIDRCDEG